jgi:hypothetical protein
MRSQWTLVKCVAQMGDSTYIAWMAITLSVLAVAARVPVSLFPAIECCEVISPGAALWAVGAFALLVKATGLPAFTTPLSKAETTDGVLLFIEIILATPASVEVSPDSPTRLE